jgi:hypothetical protein
MSICKIRLTRASALPATGSLSNLIVLRLVLIFDDNSLNYGY